MTNPPSFLAVALLLLATLAPLPARAQPASDAAASAEAWTFDFTPYFWLTEVHGDVQVRGLEAGVDVGFDEVFDLLGAGDLLGGMGHFEAHHGRLSLFVDAVGGHAAPDTHTQFAKVGTTANFAFVEFGPAYRLLEWSMGGHGKSPMAIEALAGGRYMYLYQSIDITGNQDRVKRSANATLDWVDPFVGGRWTVPIVEHLDLIFRGDIGGFGAGSELAWNLLGAFRYELPWTISSARTFALLGYKAFDFDYRTGSGAEKNKIALNLRGPALGFAFSF